MDSKTQMTSRDNMINKNKRVCNQSSLEKEIQQDKYVHMYSVCICFQRNYFKALTLEGLIY